MKSRIQYRLIIITASFFTLFSLSQPALSGSTFLTSGDYCNIQNFGGEAARKDSRKQGGGYQNMSDQYNFTVSCPLMQDPLDSDFEIMVSFTNRNTFTQIYKCSLDEYDESDDKVRTLTSASSIDSEASGSVSFVGVNYLTDGNRFYLSCKLPPQSTMGSVYLTGYGLPYY